MARSILKIEYDYDFHLVALVSALKDYRLCWLLNKEYGLNLAREKDIEINLPKKKKLSSFSLYRYDDELNYCRYYVIGNKNGGEFLLPEVKQADYLLIVKDEGRTIASDLWIEKLKAMEEIQAVFRVEAKSLKSRQNLLFLEN